MSTGSSVVSTETDKYRAEATFRHKLEQPKTMKMGDSRLSSPCIIRGLPWKIMAKCGVAKNGHRTLGFFLECNAESESKSWSCNADATLRILSQKEGVPHYERTISHVFFPKENDYGYNNFILWGVLLNPSTGLIKHDAIILEVDVRADKPHGVQVIPAPENTSDELRRGKLENAAISYLDDFIDSQVKSKGKKDVPLISFQGWIGSSGPREVRDYIGYGMTQIEDFIVARKHLWQTSEAKNATANKAIVVEKQPQLLRLALVSILAYIQRRSQRGENVTLNSISSYTGDNFSLVKAELGAGLDGIKSFLLHFPTLFTVQPFIPEPYKPANMVFKNRAIVVDDVILLPANAVRLDTGRFDGCGPVVRLETKYGFIRDLRTNEEAFFVLPTFHGPLHTFHQLATDGKDFRFQAVISSEYEAGKAKSKWFVIDMWAKDDPKVGAATEDTKVAQEAVKATAKATKTAMEAIKAGKTVVEVKATGPNSTAASVGSRSSASSVCSTASKNEKKAPPNAPKPNKELNETKVKPAAPKKPTKDQQNGGGKDDEQNGGVKAVKTIPSQNQQPNREPRSMVDLIEALEDELNEGNAASANTASALYKTDEEALAGRLEEFKRFTLTLQRQSQIQELYGKMASGSGQAAPSTSTFTALARSPPPFQPQSQASSALPHVKPCVPTILLEETKPAGVNASIVPRTLTEEMGSSSDAGRDQIPYQGRPKVVRKLIQMCDVGCQTEEFNDERELLLRILRRSPDLLKMVRAFRQTDT